MSNAFEYTFPCIRGYQAGREYYVSMCPLGLLPKIILFDEEEVVPELRAQRTLSRSRVPQIADYMLSNPNDYVFSAITVSVDGDTRFEGVTDGDKNTGRLCVPMSSRFIINDGQHRRAGIELALRENPDLARETISVVFYPDKGLERAQQIFADLNRHAVRPSRSLSLLYEHRDKKVQLTKNLVGRVPLFKGFVENERSDLSSRSRKLFTLSVLHTATWDLLDGQDREEEALEQLAADFWNEIHKHIPEWEWVRTAKLTAGDVRQDFVHAHPVVIRALGRAGNALLKQQPRHWREGLENLDQIDWLRSNGPTWEGRATIGGRIAQAGLNVVLTTNYIKTVLDLPLSRAERGFEDAFLKANSGRKEQFAVEPALSY